MLGFKGLWSSRQAMSVMAVCTNVNTLSEDLSYMGFFLSVFEAQYSLGNTTSCRFSDQRLADEHV